MGFELPRMTKCCFCVPLRIASLLIGYFSIVISCVTIGTVSFYTYRVANYVQNYNETQNTEHSLEEVQKTSIGLYISFGYYMLVFLYNIVISLLLVIGVHRNKPRLLTYYINSAYFLLALAITLVVITFVFMGFYATLAMLKWAVTIIFIITVVRSTYLEMEEQNKTKTFEMQNLYMPQQAPLIL